MRLFTALAAVALLPGTTPAGAASCSYDAPAATVLLPYFRVSLNGATTGPIPEGGRDTIVSLTNVGSTGLVVRATLWNKYGKPVLVWNVPMAGFDVAFFRMKDVLNGRLNVNPNAQNPARLPNDPCGLNVATGIYEPKTGFGGTTYVRFRNPDAGDASRAVGIHPVPAFDGPFRTRLWDSLDESGDVESLLTPEVPNVLDTDNPACGIEGDGVLLGDLSGYATFDVMNTCTTLAPDDPAGYANDAIATIGWKGSGFTPNALIGDAFLAEPGGLTGGSMPGLAFDESLEGKTVKTFYARESSSDTGAGSGAPSGYVFRGDGRTPLGTRYGFRYLADPDMALSSSLVVWRSDVAFGADGTDEADLCGWLRTCRANADACLGHGFYLPSRRVAMSIYDNDANTLVYITEPFAYALLSTQRFDLRDSSFNPGSFKGGWVDLTVIGEARTAQAYVTVEHAGPGFRVSHPASRLGPPDACFFPKPAQNERRD